MKDTSFAEILREIYWRSETSNRPESNVDSSTCMKPPEQDASKPKPTGPTQDFPLEDSSTTQAFISLHEQITLSRFQSPGPSTQHPSRLKKVYSKVYSSATVSNPNLNRCPEPQWEQHANWGSDEAIALNRMKTTAAAQRVSLATWNDHWSKEDLKRLYRRLVKRTHPDHNTSGSALFLQVQSDYKTLMDFFRKIA